MGVVGVVVLLELILVLVEVTVVVIAPAVVTGRAIARAPLCLFIRSTSFLLTM